MYSTMKMMNGFSNLFIIFITIFVEIIKMIENVLTYCSLYNYDNVRKPNSTDSS